MVAPNAAGASFDVLLQFSMDEEANKRVQNRTSTIEQELKRIQDQAKKTGKAINESMSNIDTKTGKVTTSVTRLGAEMAKLGERAKTSTKQVNDGLDSNIRKFKQLEEAAKRAKQQASQISGVAARASSIFGRGLATGALVTGGILAEANRYAKEAEAAGRATQATKEWTKATEDLARARARVDNVLIREALPLLQQAARIAAQAAGFVEKHPEIVKAALNTGVIVAGVSAVGLAVTRGIKLVADARYIAAVATELLAAKLHNQAANKELAAAAAKNVTNRADDLRAALNVGKTGGLGLGGLGLAGLGGSLAGLATSPLGNVGLIVGYAIETNKLSNNLREARDLVLQFGEKTKASSGLMAVALTSLDGIVGSVNPLAVSLKNLRDAAARDIPLIVQLFNRLTGATGNAAAAGSGSTGGRGTGRTDARGSAFADPETERAVVKAYEDYKNDDLALVQEHYKERQGIIEDALAAEQDANKQYASSVAKINANTAKSLADAAGDFEKANVRAEQQYQDQRAQIIRDGNQAIEQIERDAKERLAKLTQEHEDRVADLIGRRDALGLAKENRDFGRTISSEKGQAQQEIRERRAAIAQRLADLQASYEQERAQRLADYQARVAEIRANAAEQLKELAIQHQEELKRIRDQKIAKLKEMDAQFIEERKRRYAYLVQQIRDLDAGLLGERQIRQQYYNLMLQDAQTWLASYRAALSAGTSTGTTGGSVGGHLASGGYADPGLYHLAETGQREFVLSGPSTKAAEKIIGSQLTQANLMTALQLGGSRQMNYVDQRRIDQPVSKWDKRTIEDIAVGAMQKLMR